MGSWWSSSLGHYTPVREVCGSNLGKSQKIKYFSNLRPIFAIISLCRKYKAVRNPLATKIYLQNLSLSLFSKLEADGNRFVKNRVGGAQEEREVKDGGLPLWCKHCNHVPLKDWKELNKKKEHPWMDAKKIKNKTKKCYFKCQKS